MFILQHIHGPRTRPRTPVVDVWLIVNPTQLACPKNIQFRVNDSHNSLLLACMDEKEMGNLNFRS